MSDDSSGSQELDIDLVLVTGAGASCAFGVNGTRLPLMGDWSQFVVERLAERGSGFLPATGLTSGMDGPQFEAQLGRFLRSVAAFNTTEMLLEPLSSFPGAGVSVVPPGQWSAWHRQAAEHLAQVTEVIHESLYALFASPAVDHGGAQQAYGALFTEIGLGPASRLVYTTTNYDTIGEEMIAALGGMPDVGDYEAAPFSSERPLRVDRLLDGMPRYTPVLHLHGRVGWFRRPDGRVLSEFPAARFDARTGVPIVMLPDLEKDYATDSIISSLWTQFGEALRRAKRILVLGHSLHDEALIRTLADNVSPAARLAVTVLPSLENPNEPEGTEAFQVRERIQGRLPDARELLVRFDSDIATKGTQVREWMAEPLTPRG